MEGLAGIERGTVTKALEKRYQVASMDRPGIVTPPILAIGRESYSAGDSVYFFLFPDGSGKILSKIEE